MAWPEEEELRAQSQAHCIPGCGADLLDQEQHYTGPVDKWHGCWCEPTLLLGQDDSLLFLHKQAS